MCLIANDAVENSMKFVYFHYVCCSAIAALCFLSYFLVDGRPTARSEKQFEENLKVVSFLRDAFHHRRSMKT